MMQVNIIFCSVPGKHSFPGKYPCTAFQGVNVAASIQKYAIYIPGKSPCGPKSLVMFMRPWLLPQDTVVHVCIIIIILTLCYNN